MASRLTPKQFRLYLDRDKHCLHCGTTDDTLVPQHRANRGMGGSKTRGEDPANVIVLCSEINTKLESDSRCAALGRSYGWKLNSWSNPASCPVYDAYTGVWWVLDSDYGKQVYGEPPSTDVIVPVANT